MARTLNGKKKKPDGDDDGGYLVMLKGTKEIFFNIPEFRTRGMGKERS